MLPGWLASEETPLPPGTKLRVVIVIGTAAAAALVVLTALGTLVALVEVSGVSVIAVAPLLLIPALHSPSLGSIRRSRGFRCWREPEAVLTPSAATAASWSICCPVASAVPSSRLEAGEHQIDRTADGAPTKRGRVTRAMHHQLLP